MWGGGGVRDFTTLQTVYSFSHEAVCCVEEHRNPSFSSTTKSEYLKQVQTDVHKSDETTNISKVACDGEAILTELRGRGASQRATLCTRFQSSVDRNERTGLKWKPKGLNFSRW